MQRDIMLLFQRDAGGYWYRRAIFAQSQIPLAGRQVDSPSMPAAVDGGRTNRG
jgi:hypothetical protein